MRLVLRQIVDSRTVSETAIGCSMGKAIVILTDDIRTFTATAVLNPLYGGLASVPLVTDLFKIPESLAHAINLTKKTQLPFEQLSTPIKQAIMKGGKITF